MQNTDYSFTFATEHFRARPSGALYWPARRMLIVADLHLGRAERYARRGGALLPPFEITDTLARLAAEVAACDPLTIVSLGDGFDDDTAVQALEPDHHAQLAALTHGREMLWITGNHDPLAGVTTLPGRVLPEWSGAVTLCHDAGDAPEDGPAISGHFHPVLPFAGKRWRCFLVGDTHLILPAFGTYTGGLDLHEPVLQALVPKGRAIACGASTFAVPLPLPRRVRH